MEITRVREGVVVVEFIEKYEDRTLGKAIEAQAVKNKTKPCIYFKDEAISYQELIKWGNKVANWFSSIGVKKGDKVCTLLPNCPECLYLMFGLAKIGVVIVPLNTAHKGNILQYMINHSDAKAIVADKQYLDNIKFIEGDLTNLRTLLVHPDTVNIPQFRFDTHSFQELVSSPSTNAHPNDVIFSDPVAIMYTSGTTGVSKGVVWSHNQALWMAEQSMNEIRVTSSDIFHCWFPLFHMAGFVIALGFLIVGGTVVIIEKFSASRYWDEIKKYNATISGGFITTLKILMKQSKKEDDADNPVRAIIAGGVGAIADDFEKRFNLVLVDDYGLTEFDPITYSDYDDRTRRSIGKGLKDTEVKIVDDYDRELPPNEVGEIVARPLKPYIMMTEYYKAPEKTAEVWRNLWFHTADYGYKDKDGYIYFFDRKKDRIRRKGENVSSHELETTILSHPAIAECAAVGVPSELGEDDIKVVVKLEEGAKLLPEDLLVFCERRMAYFMVPRYVEFVEDFPRSTLQKIKKTELKTITENTWDRSKK